MKWIGILFLFFLASIETSSANSFDFDRETFREGVLDYLEDALSSRARSRQRHLRKIKDQVFEYLQFPEGSSESQERLLDYVEKLEIIEEIARETITRADLLSPELSPEQPEPSQLALQNAIFDLSKYLQSFWEKKYGRWFRKKKANRHRKWD